MTDYTDFDNDDEFLYGGIDEQTVEPQTAIEEGYSKNNIKEVIVEDDDFFDMYGGGTNHDISNANEASKDIKHVEVDSIPGQDHDIYYPPIIEDFEENYNIHDDQKTQSTYDVHDKQDVHNTQNIPDIESTQASQDIQEMQVNQNSQSDKNNQDNQNNQNNQDDQDDQDNHDIQEDQDIDPLELSTENGNLVDSSEEQEQIVKEKTEEEDDDDEEEEEEEDSDESDDIEIIMDAPPKPTDNAARNSLIIKPNFNKQLGSRHEGGQASSSRTPGVDINAIGTIDGTSIYDVDLDSFEDKPWRKPGADITDYFNYGFNEYTWKAYCAKQKQMREDQHQRKKIHVYESKQELNNLPPELQSISQPQPGGQDHSRFQQQRGRDFKHVGRRGRDQDDSVIQVVSSEREAALEELEPIPPPSMDQNEEFNMEGGGGYPQNFSGNPMGMGMFPPPEMGGPMGPPPFFDMPPTGPMNFDPSYRGQPMRNMMRPGGMPGGIPGMPGMPGITRGMPPNMQGGMPGGMPGGVPGMPRGMPGIPGGMPGGMVGRGRGMPMDERPFYSMEEPTWEMENRNSQSFRPGHGGFQGRPPTGPMLGPGGNRSDYHEWEHSPPPDAPFAHRIRPFRPPTGPATHTSSVNSPSSDRGDEERGGGDRSASGSVERSHGYTRREDERWDGSRKRTTGETPRDDDEFRAKRRH